MDRYPLTYIYRLEDSDTWTDITSIVDSASTVITQHLCSTSFKSVVDTASFRIPPKDTEMKQNLIDALFGEKDIFVKILTGDVVRFYGVVNRDNVSILSTRLTADITVSCEDISVLHLDDKVKSNVFLENKTITEIVWHLLGLAGYGYDSTKRIRTVEERTLSAFVIDSDNSDTYRSYIDDLLFEAGGYVLNFRETGVAEIVRILWDNTSITKRLLGDDKVSARGLSTKSSNLKEDGVKLKWSTLATTGPDQTVYLDSISRSVDEDGRLVGEDVVSGGYWPQDGDIIATYQEYTSDLLDKPYLYQDSRKQNEDLSIIAVKDVSAYIQATNPDGTKFENWTYPVLSSLGMTGNPEIWPTKAWYLLRNDSQNTVNIQFFTLRGTVTYRNRINEMLLPSSSDNPKEYTSKYIFNEDHAEFFSSFYWHFMSNARYVSTWSEIGGGILGETVRVRHNGNDRLQDVVVVSKESTWVGHTEIDRLTGVAVSAYNAYTISQSSSLSGGKPVGEKGEKGDTGAQGYGIVGSVNYGDQSSSVWDGYERVGNVQFYSISTSGMRVGDYISATWRRTDKTPYYSISATIKIVSIESSSKIRGETVSVIKTEDGAKGEKGNPGDTGKSVKSVYNEYGYSTSSSTPPIVFGEGTMYKGLYIWRRTVTVYSDNTVVKADPVYDEDKTNEFLATCKFGIELVTPQWTKNLRADGTETLSFRLVETGYQFLSQITVTAVGVIDETHEEPLTVITGTDPYERTVSVGTDANYSSVRFLMTGILGDSAEAYAYPIDKTEYRKYNGKVMPEDPIDGDFYLDDSRVKIYEDGKWKTVSQIQDADLKAYALAVCEHDALDSISGGSLVSSDYANFNTVITQSVTSDLISSKKFYVRDAIRSDEGIDESKPVGQRVTGERGFILDNKGNLEAKKAFLKGVVIDGASELNGEVRNAVLETNLKAGESLSNTFTHTQVNPSGYSKADLIDWLNLKRGTRNGHLDESSFNVSSMTGHNFCGYNVIRLAYIQTLPTSFSVSYGSSTWLDGSSARNGFSYQITIPKIFGAVSVNVNGRANGWVGYTWNQQEGGSSAQVNCEITHLDGTKTTTRWLNAVDNANTWWESRNYDRTVTVYGGETIRVYSGYSTGAGSSFTWFRGNCIGSCNFSYSMSSINATGWWVRLAEGDMMTLDSLLPKAVISTETYSTIGFSTPTVLKMLFNGDAFTGGINPLYHFSTSSEGSAYKLVSANVQYTVFGDSQPTVINYPSSFSWNRTSLNIGYGTSTVSLDQSVWLSSYVIEFDSTDSPVGVFTANIFVKEGSTPNIGTVEEPFTNVYAQRVFGTHWENIVDRPEIPEGVSVDSALSTTSVNPVQNRLVTNAIASKTSPEDVESHEFSVPTQTEMLAILNT